MILKELLNVLPNNAKLTIKDFMDTHIIYNNIINENIPLSKNKKLNYKVLMCEALKKDVFNIIIVNEKIFNRCQ